MITQESRLQFSQFSPSVVSDSLWRHVLQHARPPCSSPTPRIYSNSSPLSRWCHPTISSYVVPFSSFLNSFPAPGSFPMSQFFISGGRSIQLQHQSFQWIYRTDFHYDGLVGSPCIPRDSQESSPTPQFKSIIFSVLSFFTVQLTHPYMITRKAIALTRQTFIGNIMSLLLIYCLGWSWLSFQGVSIF